MKCFINGQLVDSERVAVQSMNFGQDAPHWPYVSYQAIFPVNDYLTLLAGSFGERAEDDRRFGAADEPSHYLQFRALGWPSLAEAAQRHRQLLEEFILHSLSYDSLLLLSAREPAAVQPQYLINNVESVKLSDDFISFAGRALQMY